MKQPVLVYLYEEPTASTLSLPQLANYLKETVPIFQVEVRDSFLSFHLSRFDERQRKTLIGRLAEELARAKVRDPLREERNPSPLPGEVDYERRRLADPQAKAFGLLYDGFQMMEALRRLIPPGERSLFHIHIAFTNQLFGTWDPGDRRYHARVALYGFPSLISTTGLVEAPAKPREYYFLKQQYAALGMQDAAVAALDSQFQGRFIEYDDERLTEVMKGYVMQAIMYNVTGEPFCEDKGCRLYNAHWQEEVIRAQLEGEYEFCPFHRDKLEQLKG